MKELKYFLLLLFPVLLFLTLISRQLTPTVSAQSTEITACPEGECFSSPSPSPSPSPNCIATDLKGFFQYTGNHLSGNPVKGHFENIGKGGCPDTVYVHIMGSMKDPETADWLDTQHDISRVDIGVEAGTNKDVSIPMPGE